MTAWEWGDKQEGSKYARQLRLTFKRAEAGRCIDCPNGSPKLEDGHIRCARHRAYQSGKASERYAKNKKGGL